jgi:hypothetical protein
MASPTDIRAALIDTIAAFNRSDAETVDLEVLSGWTQLAGGDSFPIDPARLAEAFDAGLRTDLHWGQLTVRAYGGSDEIAIASGRLEGSIRLPTGAMLRGPWEYFRIWKRAEGGWLPAPDCHRLPRKRAQGTCT